MALTVIKQTGEKTSRKVKLNADIFDIEPHEHVVWLDVRRILANRRQGTHKAKEKGEIKGSTRKLRKQKGSGNARVGSIKSPIFRGGGRIFGPRPRNYGFKLNKKVQVLARKSALSYKAKADGICVLEELQVEASTTKSFIKLLEGLGIAQQKVLLVLPSVDKNTVLASKNLARVQVMTADQLNTYDVLHAEKLLISEQALPLIEQILLKK